MHAYDSIRTERVEYGAVIRRLRHTRAIAQASGRIVGRQHPVGTITSHRAPQNGAGGRTLINAVIGVGLGRGTQPQAGAAYG
jgi:hypothetical protein